MVYKIFIDQIVEDSFSNPIQIIIKGFIPANSDEKSILIKSFWEIIERIQVKY